MKILACDTALEACSAALFDVSSGVLARESVAMRRGHAEALVPMIGRVMDAAGLPLPDLDRIAVTVGPGTFTGVRVGVSAARGLALAAGLPLIGIGTLEAFAASIPDIRPEAERDLPFAVALDARRGEVYLQRFSPAGEAAADAIVGAPDAAAATLGPDTVLYGTGAALLGPALEAAGFAPRLSETRLPPGPDPAAVARLAANRPVPEKPPAPAYLRPPDAKPQANRIARAGDD